MVAHYGQGTHAGGIGWTRVIRVRYRVFYSMGDYSRDGEEPPSRTERIARAETAQAVFQGLMFLLALAFVIAFLIQFYRLCTKCPGSSIAEYTKVRIFHNPGSWVCEWLCVGD